MLRSIIERAVQKVMITASLHDGIASFAQNKELSSSENWLRELDLNQRPSGYEPDELPSCSIPRPYYVIVKHDKGYFIHLKKWSDTRGSNS